MASMPCKCDIAWTLMCMSPFTMWLDSWASTPCSWERLRCSKFCRRNAHDSVSRSDPRGEGVDAGFTVEHKYLWHSRASGKR